MPHHTVRQGETIASIARQHGLTVDTIWQHAENSGLREQRQDPNILFPGDLVFVPNRTTRTEEGATETRHRFRCDGRTKLLRLCFLRNGEPRANEPYVLRVEGRDDERGELDEDGKLETSVPVTAEQAVITLNEGGSEERFVLKIGHLDPNNEIQGIQERLNNLGYYCGAEDNEAGDFTLGALTRFQQDNDLEVTGELDSTTRHKLQERYEW